MKVLKEFKEFISKGNVIDMAVGIIIGGAFTGIVNSLVKDIMMPLFGFILGRFDFTNLKWILSPQVGEKAEVALTYGVFIQKTFDFLLMSIAIFIIIKQLNRFKRKSEEEIEEKEEKVTKDIELLTEIRDLLKEESYERKNE